MKTTQEHALAGVYDTDHKPALHKCLCGKIGTWREILDHANAAQAAKGS